MKINKIRIRNFKVFKDVTIDFELSDVVVFDGPNGFGKTTIYDAIELVFTGKIRRYNALKDGLIDNRQSFQENPLFYENAGVSDSISIQIQFSIEDRIFILERVALTENISGILDFGIYKLYDKVSFDDLNGTLIDNEEKFLAGILGKNYDSNFQFLNYVEQEECLFLLKNTDKNRKNHIAHLFDLKEFELKIKRIDDIKRKVDNLCSNTKKQNIDTIESEINVLRETLLLGVSSSEYVQLFPNSNFEWDKEDLDIKTIDYASVGGTDGILDRIKILVARKDLYKQHRRNNAVNYLLDHTQQVKDYFYYKNFLDSKELYRSIKNEIASLNALSNSLNNINNQNLVNQIDFNNFAFITQDLKDQFSNTKRELQITLDELSGLDKIYADILVYRNLLKDQLLILKERGEESSQCSLCGYDWGTVEELLIQIELKASEIKAHNSEKINRFENSFALFKSGVVQAIIDLINQRLSTLNIDIVFVDGLLKFEGAHFKQIIKALDFLPSDFSQFFNQTPSSNEIIPFDEFTQQINSLKTIIDENLIEPYFGSLFNDYFEGRHEMVDTFSIVKLESKHAFLRYRWSLSQNELLTIKTNALNVERQQYNDAKEMSGKLTMLKNKYNSSLKSFQKKIIKDIEIIFHIYSGRIMQCFQGGLGLFIFSEKEGIRFQSNPYKTYDAVFSMSSGQLSALIISFTLALHKKYSQNKLILIDDPVQTMDELNLYGFIDLLRNEFYNNQIVMSTHEDMMSAFMRYKFKNYNLSEKRINLKDLLSTLPN